MLVTLKSQSRVKHSTTALPVFIPVSGESISVFCIKFSTLCLLDVSSADNLCKQFGPRSGPTKVSGLIWNWTVWHSEGSPERFFRKKWFWKNQQTTKKVGKNTQSAKSWSTGGLFLGKISRKVHWWKFKISKILNFWNSNLKTCSMPTEYFTILSLNGQLSLDRLKINQRSYYDTPNSAIWGRLSVESQPQNPEFRNNPENFHPWRSPCNQLNRR